MTPGTPSPAQALDHTMQEALQPMEQRLRQHAYLHALEEGRLTPSQLRYFVGEQSYIIPSDLRSIALLISRCAALASQQFFRAVLDGEAAALEALEPLATAVGMAPADLDAYNNDSFPTIGRAQTDLMVLALSCGMTRVASLQWNHTDGPAVFSWVGLGEGHQSLWQMEVSNAAGVALLV